MDNYLDKKVVKGYKTFELIEEEKENQMYSFREKE